MLHTSPRASRGNVFVAFTLSFLVFHVGGLNAMICLTIILTEKQTNNGILLHSGLNPAWDFWLSTRFSCCLKMKSVENISGYIREQFYRFSRGCKPRENLWNCSRKYPKIFETNFIFRQQKIEFKPMSGVIMLLCNRMFCWIFGPVQCRPDCLRPHTGSCAAVAYYYLGPSPTFWQDRRCRHWRCSAALLLTLLLISINGRLNIFRSYIRQESELILELIMF